MGVELTPKGMYGTRLSRLPRPLVKAFFGLGLVFYRLVGSRMRVQGVDLLVLTTVGARSGRERRTLLGWFPDGEDRWLVVASFGGSARDPAWYVNMARNPDKVWIEVGKQKLKVLPESLKGVEREKAWRRIVGQSPGYGTYQKKTDRKIPVVRLRAEGPLPP